MDWKDYYHVLGVDPDANQDEVTRAYRRRVQDFHPDKLHVVSAAVRLLAEEQMKQINQAYEVLSDVRARQQFHEEWRRENSPPKPEVNPANIELKDVEPGELVQASFIVTNAGGPCEKIRIISNPDSWLAIVGYKSMTEEGRLPLRVEIEARGAEWGRSYNERLTISLDGFETHVEVTLHTKPTSHTETPAGGGTYVPSAPASSWTRSTPSTTGTSRPSTVPRRSRMPPWFKGVTAAGITAFAAVIIWALIAQGGEDEQPQVARNRSGNAGNSPAQPAVSQPAVVRFTGTRGATGFEGVGGFSGPGTGSTGVDIRLISARVDLEGIVISFGVRAGERPDYLLFFPQNWKDVFGYDAGLYIEDPSGRRSFSISGFTGGHQSAFNRSVKRIDIAAREEVIVSARFPTMSGSSLSFVSPRQNGWQSEWRWDGIKVNLTSRPASASKPATLANAPALVPTPVTQTSTSFSDPYVDRVVKYRPVKRPTTIGFDDPTRVLGLPDMRAVSLGGAGSTLDLEFVDNSLVNGEGVDIRVLECGGIPDCRPNASVRERYRVYVWVGNAFALLGEGVGVGEFDLDTLGISLPVNVIRIEDLGSPSGGTPGADIDSVLALNSVPR